MYWNRGMGIIELGVVGVMMLLFLGIIVAIVLVIARSAGGGSRPHGGGAFGSTARPENPALKVLDERFARGEIDEDEYRRRRDILQG
ncbi:SHOCT domain-containing protein [uncultured Phycicoccus sp.]|uniref:SHOCT domain-containing protein n=1 Tax=uncultured Phycicoccus sp. TaxID=661422 RepID=UPI00262E9FA1|nr:SHOCT domain-containing protein [uncultured Phycicoccus sp.]